MKFRGFSEKERLALCFGIGVGIGMASLFVKGSLLEFEFV